MCVSLRWFGAKSIFLDFKLRIADFEWEYWVWAFLRDFQPNFITCSRSQWTRTSAPLCECVNVCLYIVSSSKYISTLQIIYSTKKRAPKAKDMKVVHACFLHDLPMEMSLSLSPSLISLYCLFPFVDKRYLYWSEKKTIFNLAPCRGRFVRYNFAQFYTAFDVRAKWIFGSTVVVVRHCNIVLDTAQIVDCCLVSSDLRRIMASYWEWANKGAVARNCVNWP